MCFIKILESENQSKIFMNNKQKNLSLHLTLNDDNQDQKSSISASPLISSRSPLWSSETLQIKKTLISSI